MLSRVIHLVGSAIQLLNEWGRMKKKKRKKQLKVSLTLNTIQNEGKMFGFVMINW